MVRQSRLLRYLLNQDVALRNAAIATAALRQRRRENDDIENYLAARAHQREASGSRTGT